MRDEKVGAHTPGVAAGPMNKGTPLPSTHRYPRDVTDRLRRPAWMIPPARGAVLDEETTRRDMKDAASVIDRYRYAIAWAAADSWDGCDDCRQRLEWALSMDPHDVMNGDEMAEIGKTFFATVGSSPQPTTGGSMPNNSSPDGERSEQP